MASYLSRTCCVRDHHLGRPDSALTAPPLDDVGVTVRPIPGPRQLIGVGDEARHGIGEGVMAITSACVLTLRGLI